MQTSPAPPAPQAPAPTPPRPVVAPSLAFDIAEEVAQKLEQERKGESEETMEAAAAPSNYPVVAPYGACGGESSHPCKMAGVCAACTPGWECVPKGRWYSQCLERSTGASQGAQPQQESVEEEAVEEPATRDAVPGLGLGRDVAPTSVPEAVAGVPETSVPETGVPEASVPEAVVPEAVAGAVEDGTEYPAVAPYGACGGKSSHPCGKSGACAACLPNGGQDFVCVEGNEWYSQCIPSVGESSDDAATPSEEVEEKPEQEDVEKPVQEDEEDIVAPVAMAAEPFVVPEDSEGLAGTTRFFDGCKATCSWEGNVGKTVSGPVQSCSNKFDENGNQIR